MRKKIAIFQSDFHVGGIQRSLVNLLKNLEKEDVLVDLFIFDDQNIFFPLDFRSNIHIHFCKKFPYWNRFVYFEIVYRLWNGKFKCIKDEYDLAIDFNSYWNECAVGALSVKARKRVMWVHNDVMIKAKSEVKYRILWHFFKEKLKHYDEFVAVSQGIVPSFQKKTQITDGPYRIIPNYIDTQQIREKISEDIPDGVLSKYCNEKINVVSVGRLCHQKGYDLMIDMISDVVKRRKDIHFYIIGDGPDRARLEKQITSNKLENYVTMVGNLENPFPVMKKMDAFLMMSRYEGQGMVLWEAASVGLPIVMPKHLEKYAEGICAVEDVEESLCQLKKHTPQFDPLDEYNARISNALMDLMEG